MRGGCEGGLAFGGGRIVQLEHQRWSKVRNGGGGGWGGFRGGLAPSPSGRNEPHSHEWGSRRSGGARGGSPLDWNRGISSHSMPGRPPRFPDLADRGTTNEGDAVISPLPPLGVGGGGEGRGRGRENCQRTVMGAPITVRGSGGGRERGVY